MTISTTEPRILYTGNGSTTTFAVPFDFDADADIKVELIQISDNDVTLQTLTTDYSISGTNVVFVSAPAATHKILITLGLDFEQATNYTPGDPFPAETHEDALDELAKQIKELKHVIDYNVPKLPSNTLTTTTATDTNIQANYVFSINSGVTGVELNTVENMIDISALTNATIQTDDTIIFADASDSLNPKKDTIQGIVDLAISQSAAGSLVHIDGVLQNDGVPIFDFDGTDFSITESPDNDFDITLNVERLQDIVGAMVETTNTETGITVTYQDTTGDIDFVVSDTTVAGDSGSTGITPGDTLTIAGGTGITTSMSGDTLTITNDVTQLTEEEVEDFVGGMVTGNTETNITVTYQDGDGTLDFEVADAFLLNTGDTGTGTYSITGDLTVDNLTFNGNVIGSTTGNITLTPNGSSNVALGTMTFDADQTIGVGQDNYVLTYDNGSGLISLEAATGGTTEEEVEDWVGGMVTGNTETGITVTYEDSDGTLDFVVSDTTVAGDSGSTGITPGDTLTIAGGTNATTAMSGDTLTVNVDDAFLSNSGDTGTGVYDFGGATSLEIPNSAAPTVNADGEVAIDTTVTDFSHGVMKYYSGEEMAVVAMPIAELTSPTGGHVVSYNATNDEFELAAAGGGGGDLTLVSTATASSSTTVDFDNVFDSTYDVYLIVINSMNPQTDDTILQMRFGTGGTPTYQSGASDYEWNLIEDATDRAIASADDSSDDRMDLIHTAIGEQLGSAASEHLNAFMYIYNPASTTFTTMYNGQVCYIDGSVNANTELVMGNYLATTAVTSVQFFMSSGNIDEGEFRIYGLSKS